MSRDSVGGTVFVATALCLVCSLGVSVSHVLLKPYQEANAERAMQRQILAVAGLIEPGTDLSNEEVEKLFSDRIQRRIVDLDGGKYDDTLDPADFNPRKASRDPDNSKELSQAEDVASIGRRENRSLIYLVNNDEGEVDQYVLPIRGYGLWSTLWGFLAVDSDRQTIRGITYYDQKETPGLGGEVENPNWKKQWVGKKIYDEDGNVAINVIKGTVDPTANGNEYQVDGLSGATITSQGVTYMMQFWLGKQGFRPFLNQQGEGA